MSILMFQLNSARSVEVHKNALHYAIETRNMEAIKILWKDYFAEENERKKKGSPHSVLLNKCDTGRWVYMTSAVFLLFKSLNIIWHCRQPPYFLPLHSICTVGNLNGKISFS